MINVLAQKDIHKRKKILYSLIGFIIFLLIALSILLYLENINRQKLEELEKKRNSYIEMLHFFEKTELDRIALNEILFDYLITKNATYLDGYYKGLGNLKKQLSIDEIVQMSKIKDSVLKIDSLSDQKFNDFTNQILNNPSHGKGAINNALKFKVLDEVLLSTEIEQKSKTDSVKKKGLFNRLGNALSGKVDVQKEQNDITLKMRYGNQVIVGTIDENIRKAMELVLTSYESKIFGANEFMSLLSEKNKNLIKNNDSIQNYSIHIIKDYKNSFLNLKNLTEEQYDVQMIKNRQMHWFVILSIVFLLLFLSVAFLYLTRKTFQYEHMLIEAKNELFDNLKFKDKIVSMISHEIRSPLSIISLLTTQILKKEKDKRTAQAFESVNYTSNSILLLSNQILEFSKGEEKRMQVKISEFNLHSEIENIAHSFQLLAQTKGNKLELKNKIDKNILVKSDLPKIHQLFYNLIGNAIKYTENGTISISSKLQKIESDKSHFVLKIQDTGKGISKSDLEKVLNPYQQGENSLMGYENFGVGLGLYLCKEIVELLQGTIEIDSEIDKGTHISITFPMEIITG